MPKSKKSGREKIIIAIAVIFAIAFAFSPMILEKTQPSAGIKKFASVEELSAYLQDSQSSASYYYGMNTRGGAGVAMETAKSSDMSAPAAQESLGDSSATDYSQTNIQVEGVDEADYVKNDGNYIYKITGGNVTIISAVPAQEMAIASVISIENATPSQIFVNGERLAVFGTKYSYYPMPIMEKSDISSVSGIMPPYRYSEKSFINIYDISDRSSPALVANYSVDGNYYNSRMIGGYVYLITSKYAYADDIPDAVYRCSGTEKCFNLWYFPGYDSGQQYTIVSSVNIQNPSEPNSKVFLTGYSSNLYVSNENIYVVNAKYFSVIDLLERYSSAVSEIMPEEVKTKISSILSAELFSNDEKYSAIQRTIQNYTLSLSKEEQQAFYERFSEAESKFQNETAKEMEKTSIHKIAISDGNIDYVAAGEVPGISLNQFSMDEFDGNLRIATTTNSWEDISKNHVYVLDQEMKTIGKLEDLAQGERIYSVRFIGQRAYMVTFRQVDPLFAIDLSNPASPAVLGYLKIEGVSDYLHPYDETHIIGIGRDANESGSIKGLKIALFDVSDASSIREISKIIIGDSGTYSEALYDHKAFLFSKNKSLLVIPVSLVEGEKWNAFQGAYVFNIDLENGIALKGRITHQNESSSGGYWYYNMNVRRALYIGDVLYTISDTRAMANSLADLGEISKLEIPVYSIPVIYY